MIKAHDLLEQWGVGWFGLHLPVQRAPDPMIGRSSSKFSHLKAALESFDRAIRDLPSMFVGLQDG